MQTAQHLVTHSHQEQEEKELAHGHNTSHKESHGKAIVKLAHNHGSSDTKKHEQDP